MTEDLFRRILNTTQDCIFWKNRERRFIGVNQAFLDYYGFTSEQVILGKTDEEMGWHADPEPFMNDEKRVLEGETTYRVHGKCFARGEERDILASKRPFYDEEGNIIGLVGSFIDVTDSLRKEQEIAELNNNLEEALKSEKQALRLMKEFMERIRLEVRHPLNTITTLSYIDRDSEDVIRLREDMKKINASGYYLTKMINDLLDIHSLKRDKMKLELEEIQLSEILYGIDAIAKNMAQKKRVNYGMIREYAEDICVECDPGRVQQMVLNIVSNAIRFTDPDGKVTIIVRTELYRKKQKITFIVEDDGCGIGAAFMPKVFEPMTQEKRNPNKYGKGSGLGLTVARDLARLMHGDIMVDSEEDLGSKFTVYIVL